jgi:DNA-binding response OmpR family regulator
MAVKVLCIEDEYFISELYARTLNKAGYETTVSLNGDDGLELAKTDRYEIILLDIMIPGKLGFEILRELNDRESTPKPLHAKIIITTNLDVDEKQRAELEQLADGYIVKADVTPKELVKFLQSIIPPEAAAEKSSIEYEGSASSDRSEVSYETSDTKQAAGPDEPAKPEA